MARYLQLLQPAVGAPFCAAVVRAVTAAQLRLPAEGLLHGVPAVQHAPAHMGTLLLLTGKAAQLHQLSWLLPQVLASVVHILR
jgi:hypothetical protein